MKNFKNLLIGLAILAPVVAQAQVPYGGGGGSVTTGVSIVGTPSTTETLPTITDTLAGIAATQTLTNKTYTNPTVTGTFTGSGMTFGGVGASFTANPLMQQGFYDVTVASLNAPKGGGGADDFIPGVTGRKIIPTGPGIVFYASGTPATCTAVELACDGTTNGALFVSQPGGNVIFKAPVAALVDTVAVTPFMVASAVTYGSALTRGCPINEGIIASTLGSGCTTNTDLFVQFPYVIQ